MAGRAAMIEDWVRPISDRLGRSPDELLRDGLNAGDFGRNMAQVRWEDDSSATFRYAFVTEDKSRGRIAIFTEHCGYIEMDRLRVQTVRESREPEWNARTAELSEHIIVGQRVTRLDLVGESLVLDLESESLFVELRRGLGEDLSVLEGSPGDIR